MSFSTKMKNKSKYTILSSQSWLVNFPYKETLNLAKLDKIYSLLLPANKLMTTFTSLYLIHNLLARSL